MQRTPLDLRRATAGRSQGSPGGTMPSERSFRLMYLVDGIVLFGLMVAITTARFGLSWPNFPVSSYLVGFGIATVIHIVVAYFGGLYDRENRLGNMSRLPKTAAISLIAVLIDAAASLGADQFLMPRLNLAVFAATSALVLAANRWIAQRVRTSRFGRPRVLLVGTPDDIALAEAHLDKSDRDAVIVGRRSSSSNLTQAVRESDASDVLLVSGTALSDIYPHPLTELEQRHIGVYVRLAPQDTLLGVRRTVQIAGVPFVVLRSHALPQSRAQFKRMLDLLYLLLATPVVLPVMAFVLGYTRLVAGKPAVYRQERVGRNGETFTILKLRTMYLDAESGTGPTLAEDNDPRIIPAMRWVRAIGLDELPQLWNIARGDMSLVGPRPERPELASQFEALIPGYGRRHDIRPGLTGLAQVNGDYHTDPGYKLGHDLQYLVNWSPVADLQILVRTVFNIVRRAK